MMRKQVQIERNNTSYNRRYVSGGEGLHVRHSIFECSWKSDVSGHWNSSRHCLCSWTVEPVQFLPCQSPLECDSTRIQVSQRYCGFGIRVWAISFWGSSFLSVF